MFHDKKRAISKILLKRRPHRFWRAAINFFKNRKKLVYYKCFLFGKILIIFKHVESQRPLNVSGIKINNILRPLARDKRKQVIHHIAVRINHAHSFACLNILDNKIFEKYGFSGAGLSNHIEMPPAIFILHADIGFLTAKHIAPHEQA